MAELLVVVPVVLRIRLSSTMALVPSLLMVSPLLISVNCTVAVETASRMGKSLPLPHLLYLSLRETLLMEMSQNSGARKVIINNVKATNGKYLVGINSNYGDTATITKTCAKSVKHICQEYKGTNNNNQEPSTGSEGPSKYCIYKTSDVGVC
jgi:hypothetical protein